MHSAVVLFDSAAILRYLDAAFPKTPRLFGRTRDEQWAVEAWELFTRATLAAPMMARVLRAGLFALSAHDEPALLPWVDRVMGYDKREG